MQQTTELYEVNVMTNPRQQINATGVSAKFASRALPLVRSISQKYSVLNKYILFLRKSMPSESVTFVTPHSFKQAVHLLRNAVSGNSKIIFESFAPTPTQQQLLNTSFTLSGNDNLKKKVRR